LNPRTVAIEKALEIAFMYGQIDGDHHKAWVIDQMVRALAGDDYDAWVSTYRGYPEDLEQYTWDEGIAP
jgi:hypothetical protein